LELIDFSGEKYNPKAIRMGSQLEMIITEYEEFKLLEASSKDSIEKKSIHEKLVPSLRTYLQLAGKRGWYLCYRSAEIYYKFAYVKYFEYLFQS
jgi:hypothetical protein